MHLKMAFTGTTQDVEAAKERLRIVGLNGESGAPSMIRDPTGSGVEHRPDGSLDLLGGEGPKREV